MTNPETKNLYQRIIAVMGELDYVQKEAKKNGMQYSFVSHDAVTSKIHPLLVKHGIVMLPSVTEFSQDGNRTNATVQVTFINADSPEDKHTVMFFGYGIDSQDKGPGKAVSYAVKYAMLKTFCLETGDDPERDNIDHEPAKKEKKSTKAASAARPADSNRPPAGKPLDDWTPEERFAQAKAVIAQANANQLDDWLARVRDHKVFTEEQKRELTALVRMREQQLKSTTQLVGADA